MEPFKEIVPFLKESRIAKALTETHKCYESHVRMFWKSMRYDEKEKTIYSAVQKKDENDKDIDVEVRFTVADVRRVLDLKDSDDGPIIIPEKLSKGLWFRIGYTGHVNDKYLKSRFCRPYKFMVHCIVQALSHWKGAYDKTSDYIMNIITCLVLNRPYNISQVLFNHMIDNIKGEKYIMYPRFIQMLLDDQVPNLLKDLAGELKLQHMNSDILNRLNKYKGLLEDHEPRVKGMIGKIKNAKYVAPENDLWRHEDSNSEDKSERLSEMVEKNLRFWFEKDGKRKRTPKVSPKVATPNIVIKGKIGKQESHKRIGRLFLLNVILVSVVVFIVEPEKKKSTPTLVDEPVIDPTDLVQQGVDLMKMTLDDFVKQSEVAKAAKEAAKEAET
ncbi:hypothetical protein HanPSC8_Chr15g0675431 [Helianthus annuus]|nr:hypothetical protein HanPSC8_Chr15g0675431 [Helianthus annuus]